MRKEIKDFTLDWTGLTMFVAARWEKDKTPFIVEINEPKRSNKQNALIHALFQQCADKYNAWEGKTRETTAEFWKEFFKSHLGKKIVEIDLNDNPLVVVVSTTKYTKAEISSFILKIQHYMSANFGISIDTNEINMFLNQGE